VASSAIGDRPSHIRLAPTTLAAKDGLSALFLDGFR